MVLAWLFTCGAGFHNPLGGFLILLFFVEYLFGWASGAFPFICFVVRFDVKDVITFGASPVAMVDAVVGRGSAHGAEHISEWAIFYFYF